MEAVVLRRHDAGFPSHLAGGATAGSGGGGEDFVRCDTDATGSAGCVVYATATTATTATTVATAACRVEFVMNLEMGLMLIDTVLMWLLTLCLYILFGWNGGVGLR